jgi:hypothetical protein
MRTSDLLHQHDTTDDRDGATDLFDGRAGEYRDRWGDIQTGFVDEPQRSVEQADGLVAEVITAIAERFSTERNKLERRWQDGDVSTEDLRLTLRHYRDFFERLLDAPSVSADPADGRSDDDDPSRHDRSPSDPA